MSMLSQVENGHTKVLGFVYLAFVIVKIMYALNTYVHWLLYKLIFYGYEWFSDLIQSE